VTKIGNSKRKSEGMSPFFGSISAGSPNEALHSESAWKKSERDLKMEIEPTEVMNEEADVLDLSSFPILVTSNLERLSKPESSAEVLILINIWRYTLKN
jgi:hypothetical protein